jgi:hypothetical protein
MQVGNGYNYLSAPSMDPTNSAGKDIINFLPIWNLNMRVLSLKLHQ